MIATWDTCVDNEPAVFELPGELLYAIRFMEHVGAKYELDIGLINRDYNGDIVWETGSIVRFNPPLRAGDRLLFALTEVS